MVDTEVTEAALLLATTPWFHRDGEHWEALEGDDGEDDFAKAPPSAPRTPWTGKG